MFRSFAFKINSDTMFREHKTPFRLHTLIHKQVPAVTCPNDTEVIHNNHNKHPMTPNLNDIMIQKRSLEIALMVYT